MSYQTVQDTLFSLVINFNQPESEFMKMYYHTVVARMRQMNKHREEQEKRNKAPQKRGKR